MNKLTTTLLGAFVLVAAPALSGCETETTGADGTADVDTIAVVEDDAVGMDTDMDVDGDSLEAGAEEIGAEAGAAVGRAGEAVREGAASVGDVIDENVDVGENAENQ